MCLGLNLDFLCCFRQEFSLPNVAEAVVIVVSLLLLLLLLFVVVVEEWNEIVTK